jgi:hypothetical protein
MVLYPFLFPNSPAPTGEVVVAMNVGGPDYVGSDGTVY